MTWQPLLTHDDAARARAVAREIAAALVEPPSCWLPPGTAPEFGPVANATLGMGRAGIALLFGYLARVENDDTCARQARDLIAGAAHVAASRTMSPSLSSGFTGIAWALRRLRRWGVVEVDETSFDSVDRALCAFLDAEPWPWDVDLLAGLGGIAVYALERLPRPEAVRCLELIVRGLESTARVAEDGTTWFTRPELLRADSRQTSPHGHFNHGVAHGVPGIVAVLADIGAAGIERERAFALVAGGVQWVLASRLPGGQSFPSVSGPGIEVKPTRLGWCYGAPGIAATLLRVARLLDRDDWEREALRIGAWAAERPAAYSGVEDAMLCHGAAGLGHVFNRLSQASGEPRFAQTARDWFERVYTFRRLDAGGVAGFSSFNPDPQGSERWLCEPGLLPGAAGVACALLAASSDVPPDWDRALLLSEDVAA